MSIFKIDRWIDPSTGEKVERLQFHRTSLRPPSHDPPDADHLLPASSCLLDRMAYISDVTNASTASCLGKGGREIQVTFVIAPPPSVSYLCVFCPGLPPTEFACEPIVVATEANLALIRVAFGNPNNAYRGKKHDYFVYQAADGERAPSLRWISPLKPFVFFGEHQIGLLPSYKEDHPDLYYIAALPPDNNATASQLSFYLYNSETGSWSTKTASLYGNDVDLRRFSCTKVITIGGGGSVVAWVDLWLGLLHCDVLDSSPTFRYTPLPPPLDPENSLRGCPWMTRDIAVIQGRINYVELEIRSHGNYIADGWRAVLWTRTAANPWDEDDWHEQFSVDSDFVFADPMILGKLPELRDYRGRPEPTLLRLNVGQPTLSLQGDPIVYLMAKAKLTDDDAWVLAIDMTANGKLKSVAGFGAERIVGIFFAYMHSRISGYLNLDLASGGNEELENDQASTDMQPLDAV